VGGISDCGIDFVCRLPLSRKTYLFNLLRNYRQLNPLHRKEIPTGISDYSYRDIILILQLLSGIMRTFANPNFSSMRVIIADDSMILLNQL
jgi:hypothetical protein